MRQEFRQQRRRIRPTAETNRQVRRLGNGRRDRGHRTPAPLAGEGGGHRRIGVPHGDKLRPRRADGLGVEAGMPVAGAEQGNAHLILRCGN